MAEYSKNKHIRGSSLIEITENNMKCDCGCHCIRCKSTDIESFQIGNVEADGYFDMHHTCKKCNTHFDHLDGTIFDKCDICD